MQNRYLIVNVEQGDLRGQRDNSVVCFRRVPYAANPFMPATRFLAPQPAQSWPGLRDATAAGPMPPQPSRAPGGGVSGAPDDLTLNIWAPVDVRNAPVLVWLPGGAFYRVDASEGWYDGASFARQGIIVVTVNYRVGIDGFMSIEGVPANRGFLDQIAALGWIRKNIGAFGGDPANVTLAGQSAGAQSVMTLMGIPAAAGLFQRAIAQSPPQNHLMPEAARRIASATFDALKIQPTRTALTGVGFAELITVTEAMINDLRDGAKWGAIARQPPYLPLIDGTVIAQPPLASLKQHSNAAMPLLIGCTDEEARIYLVPGGAIDKVAPPALSGALRTAALPADGEAVYRQSRTNASPGDMVAAFESDKTFRIPSLRYAEERVRSASPVWFYHFSWSSPAFGGRLGAAHVVDVPYAFNTLASNQAQPFLGGPGHQPLADAMHTRWVQFVKTGNPSWDRYNLQSRPTMRFDTHSSLVHDPLRVRRQLWSATNFE